MGQQSQITWQQFDDVDIRAGTIVSVDEFPEAHTPAYKLVIDFGPEIGAKKSSAQITSISKDELMGVQVAAVVNFPAKQIGPFISEVLTLGFADEKGDWIVMSPRKHVVNGSRLR